MRLSALSEPTTEFSKRICGRTVVCSQCPRLAVGVDLLGVAVAALGAEDAVDAPVGGRVPLEFAGLHVDGVDAPVAAVDQQGRLLLALGERGRHGGEGREDRQVARLHGGLGRLDLRAGRVGADHLGLPGRLEERRAAGQHGVAAGPAAVDGRVAGILRADAGHELVNGAAQVRDSTALAAELDLDAALLQLLEGFLAGLEVAGVVEGVGGLDQLALLEGGDAGAVDEALVEVGGAAELGPVQRVGRQPVGRLGAGVRVQVQA